MTAAAPKPHWTPPPSMTAAYLSVPQAMEALSLSKDTVYILIRSGSLVRIKYGKYTLISRASINQYLSAAAGQGLPTPVAPLKKPKKK